MVFNISQAGEFPSEWITSSISGSQHKLTLTKLQPASLYEVEMAARNCAGLGQPAMMTFRTGKGTQTYSCLEITLSSQILMHKGTVCNDSPNK